MVGKNIDINKWFYYGDGTKPSFNNINGESITSGDIAIDISVHPNKQWICIDSSNPKAIVWVERINGFDNKGTPSPKFIKNGYKIKLEDLGRVLIYNDTKSGEVFLPDVPDDLQYKFKKILIYNGTNINNSYLFINEHPNNSGIDLSGKKILTLAKDGYAELMIIRDPDNNTWVMTNNHILTSDVLIELDPSWAPTGKIHDIVASLPDDFNQYNVTMQAKDGYYKFDRHLDIKDYNNGNLYLLGNSNDFHQSLDKSVIFDFVDIPISYEYYYGITIWSCKAGVFIKGIQIKTKSDSHGDVIVGLQLSALFYAEVAYCSIVGNALPWYRSYAFNCSGFASINLYDNVFEQVGFAIGCSSGTLYSNNNINNSPGTNHLHLGLITYNGGIIIKNGTQPTGCAYADEYFFDGGIIVHRITDANLNP